jgi:hypothetical protein
VRLLRGTDWVFNCNSVSVYCVRLRHDSVTFRPLTASVDVKYLFRSNCHCDRCLSQYFSTAISVSVHQCSTMSVSVNKCCTMSVSVHQCCTMSVSVHQCCTISVSVHQCSTMSVSVHKCCTMSVSVHQCCTMSVSVHQCCTMSVSVHHCCTHLIYTGEDPKPSKRRLFCKSR